MAIAVAAVLASTAPGAAWAHADDASEVEQEAEGQAALRATPFADATYGSGVVKGQAELEEEDGRLKIKAQVQGLNPGTTHIGHIHLGDCAALSPGAIIYDLKPVTIDKNGKGGSVTVIKDTTPASLTDVQDCEWWVAFHEGPANASPQTKAVAIGPVLLEED